MFNFNTMIHESLTLVITNSCWFFSLLYLKHLPMCVGKYKKNFKRKINEDQQDQDKMISYLFMMLMIR